MAKATHACAQAALRRSWEEGSGSAFQCMAVPEAECSERDEDDDDGRPSPAPASVRHNPLFNDRKSSGGDFSPEAITLAARSATVGAISSADVGGAGGCYEGWDAAMEELSSDEDGSPPRPLGSLLMRQGDYEAGCGDVMPAEGGEHHSPEEAPPPTQSPGWLMEAEVQLQRQRSAVDGREVRRQIGAAALKVLSTVEFATTTTQFTHCTA